MPVINITSMQGFINALSSVESYTTLEIMNDLDFNDVVSTFNATVRIPSTGSTSNRTTDITINGNNHVIYNMDNSSVSGAMFSFMYCSNVVFKDISFLNCHMTKTGSRMFTSLSGFQVLFTNIVIQGRFNVVPFSYATIDNSTLTYNYCENAIGDNTTNYTRCWIKFDRCNIRALSAAIIRDCDTCYLTGSVGYTNVTSSTPIINGLTNSCVNVTFTIINSSALLLSDLFKTSSSADTNIINSEKLIFAVPSSLEDTATCKLVTDEQMKNAEYLAGIGFDIIP